MTFLGIWTHQLTSQTFKPCSSLLTIWTWHKHTTHQRRKKNINHAKCLCKQIAVRILNTSMLQILLETKTRGYGCSMFSVAKGKNSFSSDVAMALRTLGHWSLVLMDTQGPEEQASFVYLPLNKQGWTSISCPFQKPEIP